MKHTSIITSFLLMMSITYNAKITERQLSDEAQKQLHKNFVADLKEAVKAHLDISEEKESGFKATREGKGCEFYLT